MPNNFHPDRPRSPLAPARLSRISFLARLRAAKHPAFELTIRLHPIVHITDQLFAAFEIDFVCSTSDFVITRRVLG
jgi:hypothetical protein